MSQSPILVLGTVKSTKDPDKLGRVQVEVPGLAAPVKLPWLRYVAPTSSAGSGIVFLPEVGDEVAILRGAGSAVDGMVILGSVYHGKSKPATFDKDGKNAVKEIATKAGNKLTFTDKKGAESILLTTPDAKVSLLLDKKSGKATLSGAKIVAVTAADKVTVEAKMVVIKGAQKVAIEGAQEVSVKSSATVNIQGAKVKIAGSMVEIG